MDRRGTLFKSGLIILFSQCISILFSFISRNAFISGIGIDYLSLNGVINDILAMLALSELGFQSAVVYRLFKPLAENDRDSVNDILGLLKRIYLIVGSFIVIVGLSAIPLLKIVIKGIDVPFAVIVASYCFFVFSTAFGYFVAYRRTLLYADQGQYIISIIDAVCKSVFECLKLYALIGIKSYVLYAVLHLGQNICSNMVIWRYVEKKYEWLSLRNRKKDKALRNGVIEDTKNIFASSVASYVYCSTDNIVISGILGTRIVGYLGNYKTVFSMVSMLLTSVLVSFKPMIGNYLVCNDKNKSFEVFQNYSFLRYVIAQVLLCPTIVLVDVFITIWLGDMFLLNDLTVFLIFMDAYISVAHGATGEFIEASGLFSSAKKIYLLGAGVNLSFSIVGAYLIGIEGVLIGTVLSQMIMWIGRSLIVYKTLFEKNSGYMAYWVKNVVHFANALLVLWLSSLIVSYIHTNVILKFVVGGFISVAVALLDVALAYGHTNEFAYVKVSFFQYSGRLLKKLRKNGAA